MFHVCVVLDTSFCASSSRDVYLCVCTYVLQCVLSLIHTFIFTLVSLARALCVLGIVWAFFRIYARAKV